MNKSSKVKPTVNASCEKLVIEAKGRSNKPVIVQGSPACTVAPKQEHTKVTVHGAAREPIEVLEGAYIESIIVKLVIQPPVINSKAAPWRYEKAIVMYKGKEITKKVCEALGLTQSGRYFAPEELRKRRVSKDNPE